MIIVFLFTKEIFLKRRNLNTLKRYFVNNTMYSVFLYERESLMKKNYDSVPFFTCSCMNNLYVHLKIGAIAYFSF